MRIRFASLPFEMQLKIIEKLDLKDFAVFQLSSQKAKKTAERVTKPHFCQANCAVFLKEFEQYRLILSDGYRRQLSSPFSEWSPLSFRVKTIQFNISVNDELCQRLIEYFRNSSSRGVSLQLHYTYPCCSPELFHELLKLTRATNIFSNRQADLPYIRNLPSTITCISTHSVLEDGDLGCVNASTINLELTMISCKGLNTFLKDWCEERRVIDRISLSTRDFLSKEVVFQGIDYSETGNKGEFKIFNGSDTLKITMTRPMHHRFEATKM